MLALIASLTLNVVLVLVLATYVSKYSYWRRHFEGLLSRSFKEWENRHE